MHRFDGYEVLEKPQRRKTLKLPSYVRPRTLLEELDPPFGEKVFLLDHFRDGALNFPIGLVGYVPNKNKWSDYARLAWEHAGGGKCPVYFPARGVSLILLIPRRNLALG